MLLGQAFAISGSSLRPLQALRETALSHAEPAEDPEKDEIYFGV